MSTSPRANVDLSVDFAGLHLATPIVLASGTCGYGTEYAELLDYASLGAIITKSITLRPRAGNPPQRIVETRGGMLNAIGLANVGLEAFLSEKLPALRDLSPSIWANVAHDTGRDDITAADEYVEISRRLDQAEGLDALEINVSCPNVPGGMTIAADPALMEQVTGAVRRVVQAKKLVVKLSPNVTDIAAVARAAVNGGADALSLINTLVGMAIHAETRRPILGNVTGGLSGPAIKPVALAKVHQVYRSVAKAAGVPLLGVGGVQFAPDAVEMMLAGAAAVGMGTALFVDPAAPQKVVAGLRDYCERHHIARVAELTGGLRM
jgi:dihydroorotate dehydrogenase (NAD+) catalytic subunit